MNIKFGPFSINPELEELQRGLAEGIYNVLNTNAHRNFQLLLYVGIFYFIFSVAQLKCLEFIVNLGVFLGFVWPCLPTPLPYISKKTVCDLPTSGQYVFFMHGSFLGLHWYAISSFCT